MQEDIRRYFNITVTEQRRQTNCYVLKKGKTVPMSVYKKADVGEMPGSGVKFVHYASVSAIVDLLNNYLDRPLVDETGLSEKIKLDIILPLDVSDSRTIIRTLKNAGFEVNQELKTFGVDGDNCPF